MAGPWCFLIPFTNADRLPRPHLANNGRSVTPKNEVDNPALAASRFSIMSQPPETKLATPVSLVVDLVLVGAFFGIMFDILRSHVPSDDFRVIDAWSGLTAACMSGVFWLVLQMFRVVLRAQRAAKK